jgi:transposase-like protein
MCVSPSRDAAAARRFFERAVGATKVTPVEVTTDKAAACPAVLEELLPAAWHRSDRDANHRVEGDHGRCKARLRPMRGRSRTVAPGEDRWAWLRAEPATWPYDLASEEPLNQRVAVAFDELALAI